MRIFLTGSINKHVPGINQKPAESDGPFINASEQLGYEIAKAGHILLIRNPKARNIVDHYALNGSFKYCTRHENQKAKAELFFPGWFNMRLSNIPPNMKIKEFNQPDVGGISKKSELRVVHLEFLMATIRAMDRSDIIITIGDGESTRMVGSIASEREKPIIAISSFGGSSSEIYERLFVKYCSMFKDYSTFTVLSNEWNDNSAEKVIALADRFFNLERDKTKHSYFISYSTKDSYLADYIELLLIKKDKDVFRDEWSIRTGEDIHGAIAAQIYECDTFVSLGTKSYIESDWCKKELCYALNSNTKKNTRIIYLHMDESELPFEVNNKKVIEAVSRNEQKLAIMTIIGEE